MARHRLGRIAGRTGVGHSFFAQVQPPEVGLGPKDEHVHHQLRRRPVDVGMPTPFRLASPLGQQAQKRVPLMADHLQRVISISGQREQDLQHQFIAWRWFLTGYRPPPLAHFPAAAVGQAPLALPLVGVGRLDETISFETFERGVHLADVQGPDAAGRPLKRALQAVAVTGPVDQQNQQSLPYGHMHPSTQSADRY